MLPKGSPTPPAAKAARKSRNTLLPPLLLCPGRPFPTPSPPLSSPPFLFFPSFPHSLALLTYHPAQGGSERTSRLPPHACLLSLLHPHLIPLVACPPSPSLFLSTSCYLHLKSMLLKNCKHRSHQGKASHLLKWRCVPPLQLGATSLALRTNFTLSGKPPE